jgi:hypothetical protein
MYLEIAFIIQRESNNQIKISAFFFAKYTKMLYQWQLVKNKVIQSNFPGNFHDKSSLRISLLPKEFMFH